MRPYTFLTSCVQAKEKDINEMIDRAQQISYRTFVKHVDLEKVKAVLDFELGVQYGRDVGLALKDDWAVSYHKSTFKEKPCYYMTHSAIEFIFTNENE